MEKAATAVLLNMNILLAILAFLLLLAGIVGSIAPVIPGPPLGYIGLLVLHWSGYVNFSSGFLIIWAVIAVAVTVMDFILPAWMTKWFGGSRAAVIGSTLGLIAGIFFFAPIGLLVGPFVGALVGELINNQRVQAKRRELAESDSAVEPAVNTSNAKALLAALGAFLAFILGTGAKLIAGAMMMYYAIKTLF